MTPPTRTVANVRWGYADIWTAPAGTAEPASAATLVEPSSPWTGIGYTAEGAAITVGTETEEARVEEEVLAIAEDVTNVSVMVSLSFAEDVLENRALAYGIGTVATTVGGASQIAKKTLTLGFAKQNIALCIMATNGYGYKDRIYLKNVVATGDVETAYRRSPGEKRLLPVTFKMTGNVTGFSMVQQTGPTVP